MALTALTSGDANNLAGETYSKAYLDQAFLAIMNAFSNSQVFSWRKLKTVTTELRDLKARIGDLELLALIEVPILSSSMS